MFVRLLVRGIQIRAWVDGNVHHTRRGVRGGCFALLCFAWCSQPSSPVQTGPFSPSMLCPLFPPLKTHLFTSFPPNNAQTPCQKKGWLTSVHDISYKIPPFPFSISDPYPRVYPPLPSLSPCSLPISSQQTCLVPALLDQAMFPASPRKSACAASCSVQMPTFLMRRFLTVRSSSTSRAKASYICSDRQYKKKTWEYTCE